MARAYYSNADIFLVDDALSALDYQVGKSIFDNLLVGSLKKKGKTVLMVTHLLQYLPEADYILFLEEGRVTGEGDFSTLVKNNKKFSDFVMQEKGEFKFTLSPSVFDYSPDIFDEMFHKVDLEQRKHFSKAQDKKKEKNFHSIKIQETANLERTKTIRGKLTKRENKQKGRLKPKIIIEYFKNSNCSLLLLSLIHI